MERTNVFAAIIGGGAAGIVCAIRIAERHPDRHIMLIERADRIGKKLLVTGNGRCNLTNRNAAPVRYHGEGSHNLIKILFEKYNPEEILRFFGTLGLMTHTDGEGRVYPLSNSAGTVLEVLRLRLEMLRVDVRTGCDIADIRRLNHGFELHAGDTLIHTENLVIATGGNADYKGGDSGSFALLRRLSLSVAKPVPALCPVKVQADVIKMLKGVRVGAEAILYNHGSEICRTRGEVQFTSDALSGICIFDLSRYVNRGEADEIVLRLLPDLSRTEITDLLRERARTFADRTAEQMMAGLFQKSVNLALLKTAEIHPNAPMSELNSSRISALSAVIHAWRFSALRRTDFHNAQVTAGGVKRSEIDPYTFEVKACPHLYIVGEALDIDGDCGGYNLQFAFASGLCAGDSL